MDYIEDYCLSMYNTQKNQYNTLKKQNKMKSKILYLTKGNNPKSNDEDKLNEFLSTMQPSQIIHISIVQLIGANVQKVVIIHS